MRQSIIKAVVGMIFLASMGYGIEPLGDRFKLISNDEVVVIDNRSNGYFDIYEPESNAYEQSFSLPGVALDVGCGDLNGSGYDEIVGVYSNSIHIRLYNGSSWQGQNYNLGKTGMKYIGCGDYFEDSISPGYEIITATDDSIFWWKWSQSGVDLLKSVGPSGGVYDICCGDIDGDRYDEVVYLTYSKQAGPSIGCIEEDGTIGTYPLSIILNKGSFTELSAGNFREDIREELVILEPNTWPSNDKLHFYEYDLIESTFVAVGTIDIGHRGDKDLAAGNADLDQYEEIFLLRGDGKVDVFSFDGFEGTFDLGASSNPIRISAPDWDGDNAQVVFTGGPYLCSSELWPSLVISLPPYHDGIVEGECTIKYGEEYQQTQNLDATFALTAQTTVGYGYKFPGGLLEGNVSASIESGVKKHLKESQTFTWGSWYIISSNYPHNIVMASRTYYDGFFYKILDPKNLLGDTLHQDTINMAVPKAGTNAIPITLENYLVYADTIPYLPKNLLLPIQEPGDVTTYPQGYVYPTGYPIPPEELLFVNHPIYSITQGVQGGWYIKLQETQVNEEILYSKGNLVGKLSGQIPNGPSFSFQIAGAVGAEMTHQTKVGQQLEIQASMGYLHDTLSFWQWYYEYSPYIYHASSDSGGYYVLNFVAQNLGWGYPGIEEDQSLNSEMASTYLQVCPTLFRDKTDIRFSTGQGAQDVTLRIFDATGRLVRTFPILNLCNQNKSVFSVCWDGSNNAGQRLPGGVYFIRLQSDEIKRTQKIILTK